MFVIATIPLTCLPGRYILLIIEAGIYIYDPDLAYVYYIWILYVIGRPLSFLPVMILASRLKIIYTGACMELCVL